MVYFATDLPVGGAASAIVESMEKKAVQTVRAWVEFHYYTIFISSHVLFKV